MVGLFELLGHPLQNRTWASHPTQSCDFSLFYLCTLFIVLRKVECDPNGQVATASCSVLVVF